MKSIITILALLLCTLSWAQVDTTLFMRQLMGVKGVSDVKPLKSTTYNEKYVLKMKQMVDGENADKGTFQQRVIVGLKGTDRPTVLVTEGYFAHYALQPNYIEELSSLFDANVVVCEYRYFAESVPTPLNWNYMTVDNSLRDLHRVRQALGTVFTGKWLSTGISKGGQTTMFYRATYPEDVDVSVSYVAPLNRSLEDGRHEPFLAKHVGTAEERQAVFEAQKEMMVRKPRLMERFKQFCDKKGYTFNLSYEDVYDYCVMEYPFALWQWGTPTSTIPPKTDSDEAWLDYLTTTAGPDYFTCPSNFTPFFVQAARELGYYGYSQKGLKKMMTVKNTKGYLKKMMLPQELRDIKFDKKLYKRTKKFLKKNDPKHIFIYGEIDPWSASGVAGWLDCSKKQNMRVYVQPRGSHKTRISTMPQEMKADIMSRLTKWLEEK